MQIGYWLQDTDIEYRILSLYSLKILAYITKLPDKTAVEMEIPQQAD